MAKRKRRQFKVGEVVKLLSKLSQNSPVFLAPSMLNIDEPPKTQEFIDWERRVKCVAIEYSLAVPSKGVTFGWASR